MQNSNLSGQERDVYSVLLSWIKANLSFPNQKQIASCTDLSANTVRKCLQSLGDKHVIELAPSYVPGSRLCLLSRGKFRMRGKERAVLGVDNYSEYWLAVQTSPTPYPSTTTYLGCWESHEKAMAGLADLGWRPAKQFTRWLVRDRRTQVDPLAHLSKLNVSIDRRHGRRALARLEFDRLIAAAQIGRTIESITGPDRAMMYILAAWTGFRKGEIGSLTQRSLQLDVEPATATVAACFSKRRREDTQILHPEVARLLKWWLARKTVLGPDDLLFPVSGKVPGGKERKTHKMMQRDLKAARNKWIEEAETDADKELRASSDILKYCDSSGRFADFHSNRHLFITSLERANLSPKMAQTLARHSDVRLTLDVYTHVGLHDQTAAIWSLPAPPSIDVDREGTGTQCAATGTDGPSTGRQAPESAQEMVPTMVPRGPKNGAHIGAIRLASQTYQSASLYTEEGQSRNKNGDPKIAATLNDVERCCTEAARPAAVTIDQKVDRQ